MIMTTAVEMAKIAGIDPKVFSASSREERFPWHVHNHPWKVEVGRSATQRWNKF